MFGADNVGGTIGKAGPKVGFGSKLPHAIGIYTGKVDADAVKFAYDKQSWTQTTRADAVLEPTIMAREKWTAVSLATKELNECNWGSGLEV